jgi:hypothetical protein
VSTETILLLAAGYLGILVVTMAMLAAAGRADRAAGRDTGVGDEERQDAVRAPATPATPTVTGADMVPGARFERRAVRRLASPSAEDRPPLERRSARNR